MIVLIRILFMVLELGFFLYFLLVSNSSCELMLGNWFFFFKFVVLFCRMGSNVQFGSADSDGETSFFQ